ncbi:armadillo-type protein [Paraphysoderma sedebokerense]|nr:armadillo-type protein [Paraphysoderma sedebokerense]
MLTTDILSHLQLSRARENINLSTIENFIKTSDVSLQKYVNTLTANLVPTVSEQDIVSAFDNLFFQASNRALVITPLFLALLKLELILKESQQSGTNLFGELTKKLPNVDSLNATFDSISVVFGYVLYRLSKHETELSAKDKEIERLKDELGQSQKLVGELYQKLSTSSDKMVSLNAEVIRLCNELDQIEKKQQTNATVDHNKKEFAFNSLEEKLELASRTPNVPFGNISRKEALGQNVQNKLAKMSAKYISNDIKHRFLRGEGQPKMPEAAEKTEVGSVDNLSLEESLEKQFVDTKKGLDFESPLNRKRSDIDYKSWVTKIVKSNDQQASLFLQLKFKTMADADSKQSIVDAILPHGVELMKNKFGNFLMQRCFEWGYPHQRRALASLIVGKMVELSRDQYACHVVQKAIFHIDEDIKASLVSEFLRSIPDAIVHQYASHVVTAIVQTKWVTAPPAVILYFQRALVNRWHTVALNEHGSLVVQSILDSCTEDERRPIIQEILNYAIPISKGQWGNWVIQHILQYSGSTNDKQTIFDVVNAHLIDLSVSRYGSKVIEKMLKVGTKDQIIALVRKVVSPGEGGLIPLLSIAEDEFGNYVTQYILCHNHNSHRAYCIELLRPLLPRLKNSKYGRRIAGFVEKWGFGQLNCANNIDYFNGIAEDAGTSRYTNCEPVASTAFRSMSPQKFSLT